MKKMKLFLLAALLIGIGSAFTIEKSKADELWVLDEDGAGFITKTAAEAKGGHCISEFPDEPCTYLDQSGTPNPSSPMGRYVYP